MYAPVRLALDEKNLDVHVFDGKADKTRDTSQFTEHKIDFVKLFKGRSSDRGKTKVQGPAGQMTNKKKPFQQNFSTTASTKFVFNKIFNFADSRCIRFILIIFFL